MALFCGYLRRNGSPSRRVGRPFILPMDHVTNLSPPLDIVASVIHATTLGRLLAESIPSYTGRSYCRWYNGLQNKGIAQPRTGGQSEHSQWMVFHLHILSLPPLKADDDGADSRTCFFLYFLSDRIKYSTIVLVKRCIRKPPHYLCHYHQHLNKIKLIPRA